MSQLAIPTEVPVSELIRKKSLGAAFDLCAELAGKEPKQIQSDLKLDKAQWSRWTSGQEGVIWPKFQSVMDNCGNDAPLLWMCHNRGWDVGRMVRYETQVEQENRMLREEVQALRRVIQGATA